MVKPQYTKKLVTWNHPIPHGFHGICAILCKSVQNTRRTVKTSNLGTIHGHGACLSRHNLIHTNTTPIDASFVTCSGLQSLFRCNDCHVVINSLCLRWHNISHPQCNILCHIPPEMLTMSTYCMVLCCLLTCESM
jgi:hypothetical protein